MKISKLEGFTTHFPENLQSNKNEAWEDTFGHLKVCEQMAANFSELPELLSPGWVPELTGSSHHYH